MCALSLKVAIRVIHFPRIKVCSFIRYEWRLFSRFFPFFYGFTAIIHIDSNTSSHIDKEVCDILESVRWKYQWKESVQWTLSTIVEGELLLLETCTYDCVSPEVEQQFMAFLRRFCVLFSCLTMATLAVLYTGPATFVCYLLSACFQWLYLSLRQGLYHPRGLKEGAH